MSAPPASQQHSVTCTGLPLPQIEFCCCLNPSSCCKPLAAAVPLPECQGWQKCFCRLGTCCYFAQGQHQQLSLQGSWHLVYSHSCRCTDFLRKNLPQRDPHTLCFLFVEIHCFPTGLGRPLLVCQGPEAAGGGKRQEQESVPGHGCPRAVGLLRSSKEAPAQALQPALPPAAQLPSAAVGATSTRPLQYRPPPQHQRQRQHLHHGQHGGGAVCSLLSKREQTGSLPISLCCWFQLGSSAAISSLIPLCTG